MASAYQHVDAPLHRYDWLQCYQLYNTHNTTHNAPLYMKFHISTTTTLHPFNSLFSRTCWVSWYQKGKTSLDLYEATDDGVLGCSGIRWTTRKETALRSRKTPTHRHSVFTYLILFLTPNQQCQSIDNNNKQRLFNGL